MKVMNAIRSGHPATLFAAFLHFDISFMVWVLIGALGTYISKELNLGTVEKGWIVSIPLLGGAFFRIIFGFCVDRFGPKRIGIASLMIVLVPLFWGWWGATSLLQVVLIGFLLGVAGASFAVALPLASRCYPPEHQGVAMGIAGAGNSGTMIAVLIAPLLAESVGWHAVFGLAVLPVLLTLILFVVLARETGPPPAPRPLQSYAAMVRQGDLWWFNFYYGVTFGGFVGLASFLAIFFHDQYQLSPVAAGAMTALCVFSGSFFRPVGGYLADRIGGMKLLGRLYLIAALLFGAIAFLPPVFWAVGLFFFGMLTLGMGNGALFQQVSEHFQKEIGLASGIIGAAGGIGGFFFPLLLTRMKGLTHSYSGGFIFFSGLSLFCFLTLWLKSKSVETFDHSSPAGPDGPLAPQENGRVAMEVVFGG